MKPKTITLGGIRVNGPFSNWEIKEKNLTGHVFCVETKDVVRQDLKKIIGETFDGKTIVAVESFAVERQTDQLISIIT